MVRDLYEDYPPRQGRKRFMHRKKTARQQGKTEIREAPLQSEFDLQEIESCGNPDCEECG